MTSRIKAKFDGRVLIPQGPVELPRDQVLDVEIHPSVDEYPDTPLGRLAKLASRFPDDPDAPKDGAAEHDHYLYGTPKQSP